MLCKQLYMYRRLETQCEIEQLFEHEQYTTRDSWHL